MKKNLLIIMADQLRKDYLGCYGNPYVRTPNLDSLAASGVQFDQCFVNNPICMPNRLSIFTGQHPRTHGMWTNGLMLPQELPTLANHLQSQGYSTGSIGKIHFSPMEGGRKPVVSREDHRYWHEIGDSIDWYGPYWGFEYVELTVGHATRPIAHYGKWFHEHGGTDDMAKPVQTPEFDRCPVTTMPARLHDSTFIGERSAEYIRAHAGSEKPFFLVASFPDPHHPFNPPLETALQYKDTPVKLPINERDDLSTRPAHYLKHQIGAWHRAGLLTETEDMSEQERAKVKESLALIRELMDEDMLAGLGLATGANAGKPNGATISERERDQRIRNTYAMVDLIDRGIGQIVQALRDSGELENTVILFTSDHGELMGDHGLWLKGPFFYDGLVNVPLIVTAAGAPALRTDALASSIDIFPTCCELLGIAVPRSCEGVSLCAAFEGGMPRRECLIEYRNGYFQNDISSAAIVDDRYKFVQYQTGECELTDRLHDKEENLNLAHGGDHPALVAEYRERLLRLLLSTQARGPDQISHA